ncbi:MAG: bifunctional folylpolyglutamate synthase/dihydrofolate synthase [Deltaproteobacteria bacterium]|nr:MAG: bifunctional folylpolyglutamate synthase/dihydrofolate synthase [Deltaproteobacteria bacterium]
MTSKTAYNQCLKTMYGLKRFGIKLGLTTIRGILKGLGNPQNTYACIHVAGTNGKGSVASAVASILKAAGYKTGLYTSPHLVRFNERITINNRPISNKHVVDAHEAVNRVHHGNREPTFFEFSTAMALYEFGRQKVDWAVIETGMGGRLDATNIIKPALSIVTNISVEHKEYLGNSIHEIAYEKAGIIKRRTPVVTGVRQQQAIEVIGKIADAKSAPLYRLGKDFKVRRNPSGTFTYYGITQTWRELKNALLGNHQVENAAMALAACEILSAKKAQLPIRSIRSGLREIKWPGRLEAVSTDPFIFLDGAHNLIAARNLAKYISSSLKNYRLTLVIGILNDKPYKAMLRTLVPVARRVIVTCPKIDRGLAPEILYTAAKDIHSEVIIIPDVETAVGHAIQSAGSCDAVCIAGSLYVVGEAKEALAKMGYA